MRFRTRLLMVIDWLSVEPVDYIDLKAFWRDHTREQARDRSADDHFSKKYQVEVRERIIQGRRPTKPLVYSRPQLAEFAEAMNKRRMR